MSSKRRLRLFSSSRLLIVAPIAAAGALGLGASPVFAQTAPVAQQQPSPANETGAVSATAQSTDQNTSSTAPPTAVAGQVTVTARLREESIQKVPETIVAITPDVLKNNEITNFYDLQGFVPSVDVYTNYVKDFTAVLIRGFSASSYFSELPAAPSALYDMGDIQVLYGPQGTLFGYTALGGAVLYTPAHPKMNTYGAGFDLQVGDYNTTNIQGYVNIPIVQDQLALRIAVERNRRDGYVSVQNTSDKLDSNENQSFRVALQYNSPNNRFTDYTMLQLSYQDDTSTEEAVTFYNTLGAYSSVTGKTPTGILNPGPNPPYGTPAFFASVCTAANIAAVFTAGANMAQCEAQHAAVLGNFQNQALSAVALTRSSRGYTVPQPIENAPIKDPINNDILENIANYKVINWNGFLGGGDISLHNVIDITAFNNIVSDWTVGAFDYYGSPSFVGYGFGSKLVLPTPRTTLTPGSNTNPNNGFGAPTAPGYNFIYHDEFQIHGTLDTSLGSTPGLTYVIGFYNQILPSKPYNAEPTSQNLAISFDGAYNVNEGPVPTYFYSRQYDATFFGQYINLISDLGALFKPLTGLRLSGGVRFNENFYRLSYNNYATDYTANNTFGNVFPQTTPNTTADAAFASHPMNWSAAIDYVTNNNDIYFNTSYIVVPGFSNGSLPAGITSADVPGFTSTAAPEDLYDYEAGDKYHFSFGGVRGYLDADVYYETFTDVQIPETVFVPSTGNYVVYTGNPADEIRKGVEIQGEIFPIRGLDIYGNVSYADDYYSKYLSSDPTSYFQATNGYLGTYSIAPGAVNSPLCVPGASAATVAAGNTTGTCILNFKKSPLPFAPKWQASLRVTYTYPLPDNFGSLLGSVTANYTSNEFFQGGYADIPLLREEQLLGPGVAAAESSPAHTLVNLRLQWNNPLGYHNISVAGYMTNVFDRRYPDGSLDFLFATGVATQDFGPPRMFGIDINGTF